jgi:hypothetical protein
MAKDRPHETCFWLWRVGGVTVGTNLGVLSDDGRSMWLKYVLARPHPPYIPQPSPVACSHRCDLRLPELGFAEAPVPAPTMQRRLSPVDSERGGRQRASRPLVCLAACSTTRGLDSPGTHNMALFEKLLPSLLTTIEEGFDYRVYVGFDTAPVPDPFWSAQANRDAAQAWFEARVGGPARKRGLSVAMMLRGSHNPLRKPVSLTFAHHPCAQPS